MKCYWSFIVCFISVILIIKFVIIYNLISVMNNVDWNENVGRSCEFIGQNLSHFNIRANKCSSLCAETRNCTHYVWNKYEGGTCWLKKGHATKKDAIRILNPNGFCGITTSKISAKLKQTSLDKFTKCQFLYGRDYTSNGADKSDYSNYSYITIWLGSIRTKCHRHRSHCTNFNELYHGAMLKEALASNKIPVFYSFIIGFEAYNLKFLNDDCDHSPNICQKGSQFIRTNKKHILEKYRHQSYQIAEIITKKGFCVFLIEPFFWNYYGYQSQQGNPLTGYEMRSLFDEIVFIIKEYLPNAAIAWNINPKLSEDEMKVWWGFFQNSTNIDFIYTNGADSHGEISQILPNNLTWKFMSSLTGKKIIADSGYGTFDSHSNNRPWYNPKHVDDRISDGVIAVTLMSSKKSPRLHKKINSMPEKISPLTHASNVKSSKSKNPSASFKIPIKASTRESLDFNKKKYFKAEIDKLSTLRSADSIASQSLYVRKKEQELRHENILNPSKSRECKLKIKESAQKNTNTASHLYDESLILNGNILSSTLIETQPDIECITLNYLQHIKKAYLDNNFGKEEQMSSSFLEKFFNEECLANEKNLDAESNHNSLTIETKELVANEISKDKVNTSKEINEDIFIKNCDESNNSTESIQEVNSFKDDKVTSFLDFFFEKKNPMANISVDKVVEANEKENNKPLREITSGSENVDQQNIDQKIKYLEQLQLDEELRTIISTYIKLYKEFSDRRIQLYVQTRKSCNCTSNALECCLENFYNQIENLASVEEYNILKGCCQNCQHYRVSIMEKSPLWYDSLSGSEMAQKLYFINDALYVHRILKTKYVQDFLKRPNKCKCVKLSCCIEKIFSYASQSKEMKIENFKCFSCCENCDNEVQNSKVQPKESNLLPTSANKKRQVFRQISGGSSSSSLEAEDKIKEIKANEILEPVLENSRCTVQSIDDFFESMHLSSISIANRFIDRSLNSKAKIIENKSYPQIKSVIKDKSNLKIDENKKTKTVRFHDAKHGFYPIKIQEWQENLREPIYSLENSLNNPEWQFEKSKNDYELTKSRRSSLSSL